MKRLLVACVVASGVAWSLLAQSQARAQAPAPAPRCSESPGSDCLYFPAASFAFTRFERTTFYNDIAGEQREVRFLIRQPIGAPLPMAALVWSHGGADGKLSPATSMVEWSETTARAGYFTLSVAHAHREAGSRRRLCNAIGMTDDAACTAFKYLNWDRPHDLRAVLDALESLAVGEFSSQIDVARVAIGGHPAGSGGALSVGGAKRIFEADPVEVADPRPLAFLAFSPQQPGSEGIFDTRFEMSPAGRGPGEVR